jgi:hypothetical protein
VTDLHPDPLQLAHRVHVHASDDGYEARCTCGWSCCRPSRELRQKAIDQHLAVPRTRGHHGYVSEGD